MNHLERMTARLEAHKNKQKSGIPNYTEYLSTLRTGKNWRHVVPIDNALVAQCSCRCTVPNLDCPYVGREVDSAVD